MSNALCFADVFRRPEPGREVGRLAAGLPRRSCLLVPRPLLRASLRNVRRRKKFRIRESRLRCRQFHFRHETWEGLLSSLQVNAATSASLY